MREVKGLCAIREGLTLMLLIFAEIAVLWYTNHRICIFENPKRLKIVMLHWDPALLKQAQHLRAVAASDAITLCLCFHVDGDAQIPGGAELRMVRIRALYYDKRT